MLTTILLSFCIVLGAFGAMAIGVMLGRARIRGSCGGIGNGDCEICGSDRKKPALPVQPEQEKL